MDLQNYGRLLGAKVDDSFYEDKYMCGGTDEDKCLKAYGVSADDESDDDSGAGDTIMLGIVLCTVGSICLNCGNNIQALGLQGQEAEDKAKEETGRKQVRASPSLHRIIDAAEGAIEEILSPEEAQQASEVEGGKKGRSNKDIIIIGTVIFVCGSLLTFGSFAFAPQSVLAPLEAVQFVSNVFFSKFILKREITVKQVIGTCLIILGCIMAILFHQFQLIFLGKEPAGNGPYPVPFLMHLYESPVTQAFLIFVGVAALGLHITYTTYTKKEKEGNPWPRSSTIRPLCYSMISALFGGGIMIVQAKCLSSVFLLWTSGCHQWCHWFSYIVIATWLITVTIWLTRMEVALKLFDSAFMIPLLQVQFILFAIIGGGIYFHEFDAFLWYQWIGFWGGIGLVCFGLSLLSGMGEPGHAPGKPENERGTSKVVPLVAAPLEVESGPTEEIPPETPPAPSEVAP